MNALTTVGLVKHFGRATVLNRLDMAVPEGSIYAFIGVNGAGKTTTIRILMNALEPTSGCAEVFGRNSQRLSPKDFTQIGYVSQDQDLPDGMTVGFLLRYLKPLYPSWDDARAEKLLHDFALPKDRKLAHLSHGMRIKAALASSLAYHPKLLVLDEPFTGLDPLARDELIQGTLAHAAGTTIFVSSHDLSEVESFASHVGYLDQGRLLFSEKLTSLSGRFRQIEVTGEDNWPAISQIPVGWINLERSANRISFVDSQFENDRTMASIRALFGTGTAVTVQAMSLRAIFLVLAKSRKTEA